MKFTTRLFQLTLLTSIGFGIANVQASDDEEMDEGMYAVTVTNLTRGETFTPIMVATHTKGTHVFMMGNLPVMNLPRWQKAATLILYLPC